MTTPSAGPATGSGAAAYNAQQQLVVQGLVAPSGGVSDFMAQRVLAITAGAALGAGAVPPATVMQAVITAFAGAAAGVATSPVPSAPVASSTHPGSDASAASDGGEHVSITTGVLWDYDRSNAADVSAFHPPPSGTGGWLRFKLGEQLGQAQYQPGAPGGPGGPPAPAPGAVALAAPNVGAGWEVRVYAAPAYNVLLAIIPPKVLQTFSFTKQLKDLGSGTVTLNMDDSFWKSVTLPNSQPAHYLLDYEHLWQIVQDGVVRFEFLGETVTEQLEDTSEQRIATVAGPGGGATLKWAMAAPPGFPNAVVYKLDAITDSFSEVNQQGQFVVDYGLWNASQNTPQISINPSGSVRLVAHPAGGGATILGTTAYDATSTLVSAQVSPIVSPNSSGATLDGSQVTQMYIQDTSNAAEYALIGLSGTTFYAQYSDSGGVQTKTIASAAQFNTAASGTNVYQYWQISENNGTFYFWTSADGQNWSQRWSVVHSHWNPVSVGLFFAAQYDVSNSQATTITALNSNITTSSLGGPLYFNKPIIGGVWLDLLAKAQARGTVPFITTGALSAATDSFGNPWTDSQSVQIQNGTDLYTLLQAHVSMINADWVVQPGFRLQVGLPEPGKITLGYDRSNTVVFRDGYDCTARVRTRARNQIQNLLGVINADGRTLVASDTSSEALYGQREGWLQAAMQISQADLALVATAADLQNATEVLSYTLQVAPYRPGRSVFTGYDVGDWVGLERPDFSAVDKVRVVAIAVQVDSTGAETHELVLSTYIQWLTEQLQFIATKMGGGFVSVSGTTAIPDNAQLTNLNTPTIASPTLPGLAGVLAGGPSAGAPLVYDPNTGQWVPAGTIFADTGQPANVVIQGQGGQVVLSGQGTVTVQPVPAPPADGPGSPSPPASGQVIGVFNTTITDATGTVRQVIGVQPDGTVTSKDYNGGAPGVPDTPVVTATMLGLVVTWDGLLNGTAPLSDFLWVEVHVSTSSGFTPSTATLKGTLVSAAVFPVTGLTAGTTYYVRLLARNTSGVASGTSAQASAVPTAVTATVTGASQLGCLNFNPYFTAGDGTSWLGFNGTFTVSTSPPSGTPYPDAGLFTVTTAGVGAAAEESGIPFRAAASQPYYVTAWVYSPQTSCVIGFDWLTTALGFIATTTQTITIPANTWTLVTTVQTSPANAAWAYARVAPLDGAGNSIYFTAVLCLQQVPGGLIQSGTITSTQIAANTISAANIATQTITAAQIQNGTLTATQIAGGTITTNQIAANTITGANIAGGTITGSNVQAGTLTAGLLAAGIVKAGIVDGTSISAATFVAYGSSGELLIYTGTPAAGNMLLTVSGAAGSDGFNNSFDQGLTLTALPGLTSLFTVQDTSGNTLAGIDNMGNITGQVVNAAMDVQIGGSSVSTLVADAAGGVVNQGIQGMPYPSGAPSSQFGTTETALWELDFAVQSGRVYRVSVSNGICFTNTADVRVILNMHYTDDGSAPTTSSLSIGQATSQVHTSGVYAQSPYIEGYYAATANTTVKVLVTGYVTAGTFYFGNANIYVVAEDLGPSTWANNLISGGGASRQTYTEYFYPSTTWSYYSSGPTLRGSNTSMYHGAYSGESDYQYAYIQWGTGSNGHSVSSLLGLGGISSVHLRLTNLHSWYSNGMTWGLHYSNSLGSSSYSVLISSAFISEGNTYDYNLSSSQWTNLMTAGNYTVLAPDSANLHNLSWYGYFYGGGGSQTYMPRLKVVSTY